jgi:hypothetical protein
MATKPEIQAHIAKKLRADVESNIDGAYVRDSLTEQITINDWNAIATWLLDKDFKSIGKHIGTLVRNTVVSDADSEATQVLADNLLTLDEYARTEGL